MFKLLKSIFLTDHKSLGCELKTRIIESSSQEQWFNDYFSGGIELLETEKNGAVFSDYAGSFGRQIREAIVRNYLIENEYVSKLMLKKKQLIFTDAYGDLVFSDWENELKKFAKKRSCKVLERLESYTPKPLVDALVDTGQWNCYLFQDDLWGTNLCDCIENALEDALLEYMDSESDDEESPTIEDPYEYEHFIARKLSELGWDAYPTSGSGDQGADVVAEKLGVRFVIQCKLYSQPVGNKAVQEVSSARDFYDAAGAVVVTNNDYTKSARQLAESQTVWLLHDSQLEDFTNSVDEMIERVS